jgi:hypothetical protein
MPPPRAHIDLLSPNEGSRYCRLDRQRQSHSAWSHTPNAGAEIIAVANDLALDIHQRMMLLPDFTNPWEQSLSGTQSRGTVRRLLKTLPFLSGSHP